MNRLNLDREKERMGMKLETIFVDVGNNIWATALCFVIHAINMKVFRLKEQLRTLVLLKEDLRKTINRILIQIKLRFKNHNRAYHLLKQLNISHYFPFLKSKWRCLRDILTLFKETVTLKNQLLFQNSYKLSKESNRKTKKELNFLLQLTRY